MIDTLAGAEESRAKELEDRKAALLQCIEAGQIGFVSTVMYSPEGPKRLQGSKKLQESNFGEISQEVLGILPIDDMTGYLIVDCSGREGSKTPRSVADKMATILNERGNKNVARPWPGTFISSYYPAPQSPEEPDIRILGEATLHDKKLQLLKSDPTRVTPLLFSKNT